MLTYLQYALNFIAVMLVGGLTLAGITILLACWWLWCALGKHGDDEQ